MKVFLIYPAADYTNLRFSTMTFSPPLGLLYIASSLRENGIDLKLVDQCGERISDARLMRRIEKYSPDIVGFSTMSWQASKATKLSWMVKEKLPDVHIVFGGVHATLNAEYLMGKYPHIDSTIMGEGELSMLELVRALERGDSLRSVHGLFYRENGLLKAGAPRQLIKDLDSIPFPARDLVKKEWYGRVEGLKWSKMTALVSSRGCPYSCIFCCCNQFAGRKWRSRSPENIVDEIEELLHMGYKTIFFVDDNFTMSRKRILRICKLVKQRSLEFDWLCEGRADQIDYSTVRHMVKAGCKLFYLGVESANKRILEYYRKRVTTEMAMQAANTLRRAEMPIILGTFIVGAPGETLDEVKATIDFAMKMNIDFPQFNMLGAMRGTELWNQLVTKGRIDPEQYWETGVLVSDIYPHSVPTVILEKLINCGYDRFVSRKEFLFRELLLTVKSRFRIRLLLTNLAHAHQVMDYVKGKFIPEDKQSKNSLNHLEPKSDEHTCKMQCMPGK